MGILRAFQSLSAEVTALADMYNGFRAPSPEDDLSRKPFTCDVMSQAHVCASISLAYRIRSSCDKEFHGLPVTSLLSGVIIPPESRPRPPFMTHKGIYAPSQQTLAHGRLLQPDRRDIKLTTAFIIAPATPVPTACGATRPGAPCRLQILFHSKTLCKACNFSREGRQSCIGEAHLAY